MSQTHAEIIRAATVPKVHSFLSTLEMEVPTLSGIQRWATRDSIPGEYWKALAEGGFATLDELAAYAESKKVPPSPPGAAAAPAE